MKPKIWSYALYSRLEYFDTLNINWFYCKIRELVDLNKQTITTYPKKAEELIANQVVYVEAIIMMGDDIFDLRIENEALRGKLGEVDETAFSVNTIVSDNLLTLTNYIYH